MRRFWEEADISLEKTLETGACRHSSSKSRDQTKHDAYASRPRLRLFVLRASLALLGCHPLARHVGVRATDRIACLGTAAMTLHQSDKACATVAFCLYSRCGTRSTAVASADAAGLWNGVLPGLTSFADCESATRSVPISMKRFLLWVAS